MQRQDIINAVKARDLQVLEQAIRAGIDLNFHDTDTGRSLANMIIDSNDDAMSTLFMSCDRFDWGLPDQVNAKAVHVTPKPVTTSQTLDRAYAASGQARLWAQQFLLPTNNQTVYHIPVGLPLVGRYRPEAITQALSALMRQHEMLRATLKSSATELEIVLDDTLACPLTMQTFAKSDPAFTAFVEQHFAQPFSFSDGLLWRVALIKHTEEEAYLYFVYHHILLDGDSLDILARDFAKFYNQACRGELSTIQPTTKFLAALSNKQPAIPEDLTFWKNKLANFPELSAPLLDRPRPAIPSYRGNQVAFKLPLPADIKSICERYHSSITGLMFATYNLLLYKLTGQEDLIIGATTSSRSSTALQDVVGYFIDTLPIRSLINPAQTLQELVQTVAINRTEAYAHQSVDFPTMIEALNLQPNPAITPLFQCFFIMMEQSTLLTYPLENMAPLNSLQARGLTFDLLAHHTAKYDLTLRVDQQGQELLCAFEYATDCYHEETITHMAEYLQHLFNVVLQHPSMTCEAVSLQSADMLAAQLPAILPAKPSACLFDKIKHYANYRPHHLALADQTTSITYAELYQRICHLAAVIRTNVTDAAPIIGVAMPRSCDLIIAQLAVLACGGTYVPLDIGHPPARWESIIQQSQAQCVITATSIPELAIKQLVLSKHLFTRNQSYPAIAKRSRAIPAYIMFTSGSTGQPKGIAVGYAALMDYLDSCQTVFPLSKDDHWLSVTNPCFDISGYEYYGPLLAGARCTILDAVTVQDGSLLKQQLATLQPNVLQATPITWQKLSQAKWVIPAGFRGICGGERMPEVVHRYLVSSAGHFYNFYGPTEATIWATYTLMRAEVQPNNIGIPLPHMRAYVLDRKRQFVPIGVPGELYLAGSGLADGYWQQADKTNAVFCQIPALPNERLYQTGDKVRMLADGSIEYLSRFDQQVKVGGYRIELGEVESILATVAGVQNCAVLRDGNQAQPTLIACVESAPDHHLTVDELKNALAKRVPDYMIPARFYFMPQLPTNDRGKIDREGLKLACAKLAPQAEAEELPPSDYLSWLVTYLKQQLPIELADAELARKNFFELGLKSRTIIELASAFSRAMHEKIEPTWFYQYPNVQLLCRYLSDKKNTLSLTLAPTLSANPHREPIAIIGMACRFPGAENTEAFWSLLINEQSGLHRYTQAELRALNLPETLTSQVRYVPVSGRLQHIDMFDANFFEFTPKEAQLTSPAQRILMETVWHALEDAGCAAIDNTLNPVGLYAGCGDNDYFIGGYQDQTHYQAMLGTEKDYLATRIAYKLNLTGPAISVQTACSSSLVAMHLAMNSLQQGECSIAIAGGVSIIPVKPGGYLANDGFMFSKKGSCSPFGATADGIVATHGVAAVVMKPLSQAMQDGDHVYAVVKGSATNNDGSIKAGYTAPSPDRQAAVIAAAQQRAQVTPESISYIEAHGTGTALGDPIEVAGLHKVFGHLAPHQIALGSVKSNIGHSIAAAGLAGVIKTSLALEEKILPATLYATTTNPDIDFQHSPLSIQQHTAPWQATQLPRRAGVSSFGVGGTNAHVILEEAPQPPATTPASKSCVITLSAKTPTALKKQCELLLEYITHHPDAPLADIAYTLTSGRQAMSHRYAVAVTTTNELIQALTTAIAQPQPDSTLMPDTLLFAVQPLQLSEWHAFQDWYQHDVAFQELVQQQAEMYAVVLGDLHQHSAQAQPDAYTLLGLSLIFQYAALLRYQSAGVKTLPLTGAWQRVLQQALQQEITLEQALRDVLTRKQAEPAHNAAIPVHHAESAFQAAILALYRQGGKVNWHSYWRHQHRQKLRLPLYPFERQSFWQEANLNKQQPVTKVSNGLLGIGPIQISDTTFIFQQELDGLAVNLRYLLGHRLYASCVFPGAGYTELLLSAAKRLQQGGAIDLQQVNYREALILREDEIRICQVSLTLETRDAAQHHYLAKITSFVKGSNPASAVTHAEAQIRLHPTLQRSQPRVDIERLAKPYTNQQDVGGIYAALANDGVHYAGEFQGVKAFAYHAAQNKGFASIQLASSLTTDGYTIHPVVLDSAFQALAGVLLHDKAVPADVTYMPIGHGKLQVFRDCGAKAYAQVTQQAVKQGKDLSGDIAIYHESGELALLINGLCLTPVPKLAIAKKLGATPASNIHYRLQYVAETATTQTSKLTNWLVIGDDAITLPGNSQTLRHADITNPKVIEPLLQAFTGEVGVVYVAAGLTAPTATLRAAAQLQGVWSLVELAQQLSKHHISVQRFFVVSTHGLVSPANATLTDLDHGVYRGLTTSLAAARPNWHVSLLDIEAPDTLSRIIQQEVNTQSQGEMMICYRQAKRLVARLEPYQETIPAIIPESYFADHETCLITGGLGALGLRLAEWLVHKGAKHLVLLNRQKPKEEPALLRTLRDKQVVVETKAVDISDYDALNAVFQQIRADQKQLVGIYHLAGLLRDKLLEQLTPDDFAAVFAAKVTGSYHLHACSLNEPALRYFVLFSSLVSLIGSPAQLNYAAANGFLDHLADYRTANKLPSQLINFGAFAEAGMAANLSVAQRSRGMDQITIAEGLDAVGKSMTTRHYHAAVARVDWQKLWRGRDQINLVSQMVKPVTPSQNTAGDWWEKLLAATPVLRTSMMRDYVVQCLCEVSGFDKAQFEQQADTGFTEQGLDSMAMGALQQMIRDHFAPHISLEGELFYDHPSLQRLVTFLMQQVSALLVTSQTDDNKTLFIQNWIKQVDKNRKLDRAEEACLKGNIAVIKALIARRMLNTQQAYPVPLILLAAISGQVELVRLLLGNGFTLQATATAQHIDALAIAVVLGHSDLVAALLQENITVQDWVKQLATNTTITTHLNAKRGMTL